MQEGLELTYEEIINDLQSVAGALRQRTLSVDDYERSGKYPYWEIKSKCEGWNNALKVAGLNRYNPKPTRKEIIKDLQKTAGMLNSESISKEKYNIYGKYNVWSAKHKFNTWNKALKAAGLKVNRQSEYTEEDLIKNLIEIKEKLGRVPYVKDTNRRFSKFSIIPYIKIFGSWNKTLEKAGFTVNLSRNITDKELIINLNATKEKLGRVPKAIDMKQPISKFTAEAYLRKFGTWNKALEIAGFKINRVRTVSVEELNENLKEAKQKLGRVPLSGEMKEPISKYSIASYSNKFGSWNKALEKNGFEVNHDINISDKKLLTNLKEVYEKLGRTPNADDMKRPLSKYGLSIYATRFGTWNNALEIAGFKVNRISYIQDEELLKNLKEVYEKLGRSPMVKEMVSPLSNYVASSYEKRFGSWNNALLMAGLTINLSRNITEEDLLDNLKEIKNKIGKAPGIQDLKPPVSKYSIGPYLKQFGSIKKARTKAGMTRVNITRIDNEELIINLHELRDKLGRAPTNFDMMKPLSKYSIGPYIMRFGSWNKALIKAGFTINHSNEPVNKVDLINNLKVIAKKLKRTPKYDDLKKPLSKYSVHPYERRFGSWNKALELAGFAPNIAIHITDEELIANIKEIQIKLGKIPLIKEIKKPLSKYAWHVYKSRFGNLKKTLKRAGLTKLSGKITDEELLQNLKEICIKLGRKPMCMEIDKPLSKYSRGTYHNRFGSWRKALEELNAEL